MSPSGRGQIVTHNLYPPDELDKVKRNMSASAEGASFVAQTDAGRTGPRAPHQVSTAAGATPRTSDDVDQLRREVEELRDELQRLRNDVDDIWAQIR